jgi:hypothetical protein
MTTVKSNSGTSNTGSITSLWARLDEIAEIMFPRATIPIVPKKTRVKRVKRSGISTGKNTKNINSVNNSRQDITRRLASNFPKYIDEGNIGASNNPSTVPCSISLLYVRDKENIPAKKNDIQIIGDASWFSEKSMIEKANLKDAIIIKDNIR